MNKDMQRKIALELEPHDLVNFCLTNKEYKRNICDSKYFWREKLSRDYPFLIVFANKIDPKKLYVKRFSWISRQIETLTDRFIDDVYGIIILDKSTRKNFYRVFMKMYQILQDEEEEYEEAEAQEAEAQEDSENEYESQNEILMDLFENLFPPFGRGTEVFGDLFYLYKERLNKIIVEETILSIDQIV